MSASEQQRVEWLAPDFWERLGLLEERHQRVRSEHNDARRGLDRLSPQDPAALRQAWQHYCDVIAELDRTTAELEMLRTCAD